MANIGPTTTPTSAISGIAKLTNGVASAAVSGTDYQAAITQVASASQAAVVTTAATQTSPYGFATQAQADAIVTLVNALRSAAVTQGLIKGSA